MGMAGLKELMRYPGKYKVTVLARDSKKNRRKLRDFEEQGIKIIRGDLLDAQSIREGVEGADIVLHVGGMVSPMAEHYPEKTLKVNVGSMKLIASIVKDIETRNPDREIKVVYIGSVSQYGSKLPPHHWGKVGDELKAAKFDTYSESKILAENALKESGVKKWVSIRQTSILHAGLLKNINNPVIFHTPLQGVLEWITTEDSGRLLERVCDPTLPDTFWNKEYNAGGGEKFRKTNYEFESELLKAIGCPPPEKIFETSWFCADNFHGMWFEDSDLLESVLHFRGDDSFEEALQRLKATLPFYYKLSPLAPSFLIKWWMKKVAGKAPLGPLSWVKNKEMEKIEASWGSLEKYSNSPSWEELKSKPKLIRKK